MKDTLPRLLGVIAIAALSNADVRAATPIQKHVHVATSSLPFVVAVVSDHYTNQGEFDSDVDNFFKYGLLAHDYYDDHAAELDIYSFYAPLTAGQQSDYAFDVDTPSQNCVLSWSDASGTDGTLAKLLAVVSGVNPDRIVVIGDHEYNIGCTSGKWTYVAKDAAGTDVLPHEMGHGFGGLKDEWFFEINRGVDHPGIPDSETRNCFDPRAPGTIPPWLTPPAAAKFPGAGSVAGCDFFELNAVHPFDHLVNGHNYCLMGASHDAEFCPVCHELMQEEFRLRDPENPDVTNPDAQIPAPPTGLRIVKTAFVQPTPAPGTAKPTPKGAPPPSGVILKPVPAKPILQLVVAFDPRTGKITPKKGFSITARFAPSHRRLGEWAYEIVNPTLKPEDEIVEVGVFPSNLFRASSYQGGVAHQTTTPQTTDVTIQIPDLPTDFAKTGTPPVIIRIYRLRPNVTDKLITPAVFRRLKSDGDAERVGPDLTAKDILGVM